MYVENIAKRRIIIFGTTAETAIAELNKIRDFLNLMSIPIILERFSKNEARIETGYCRYDALEFTAPTRGMKCDSIYYERALEDSEEFLTVARPMLRGKVRNNFIAF